MHLHEGMRCTCTCKTPDPTMSVYTFMLPLRNDKVEMKDAIRAMPETIEFDGICRGCNDPHAANPIELHSFPVCITDKFEIHPSCMHHHQNCNDCRGLHLAEDTMERHFLLVHIPYCSHNNQCRQSALAWWDKYVLKNMHEV